MHSQRNGVFPINNSNQKRFFFVVFFYLFKSLNIKIDESLWKKGWGKYTIVEPINRAKQKSSKLRHKDKIWKDTWANYSDLGDLVLKEGIYVCPLILFEMFALCIV